MEKYSAKWAGVAALLLFLLPGVQELVRAGTPGEKINVALFSRLVPGGALPHGWAPQVFRKIKHRTEYRVVNEGGRVAVRADSRNASSGLTRKIDIDPIRYPVIRWQWKISGILEKGDVRRKSGDDYPARIYVTFAFDPDRAGFWEKAKYEAVRAVYGAYPPAGALSYIWANKAPLGKIFPNPFTDRVRMIPVQSGQSLAGTWISQSRNVLEDYRRAFGQDPPMISGVAIMTDTDNTGESATAWYGDIVFEMGK